MTSNSAAARNIDPSSVPPERVAINFQDRGRSLVGAGASGRQWRITPVVTGWRLEFIDQGDATPTNAGVHGSVAAAQAEANVPMSRRFASGRHGA
jgi:hypothetical protein